MPPSNVDVTVGESIILPCQVSRDPSTRVAFLWAFNGNFLDLKTGAAAHFERVGGVSSWGFHVPKCSDESMPLLLCPSFCAWLFMVLHLLLFCAFYRNVCFLDVVLTNGRIR